jgi:hypothetical protein
LAFTLIYLRRQVSLFSNFGKYVEIFRKNYSLAFNLDETDTETYRQALDTDRYPDPPKIQNDADATQSDPQQCMKYFLDLLL